MSNDDGFYIVRGNVREPLRVRHYGHWAWMRDADGEFVEQGSYLDCGHEVTARSRVSDTQLGRNLRRKIARHRHAPGTPVDVE